MADIKDTTDVGNAREMLEFEVDAFLRTKGWTSTSSNPAALWLWEKKLPDGRWVMVDKNTALHFVAAEENG